MSDKILTPATMATNFLDRYEEFCNGKAITKPVIDNITSDFIINHININPQSVLNFLVQTNYLIKRGLDERYGANSEYATLGLVEWMNVMNG